MYNVEGWKSAAFAHGLDTRMQASIERASNRNATDIALVIDAMVSAAINTSSRCHTHLEPPPERWSARPQDILYSPASSVDGFVIVSNDGDFAPLAQRLRRQGKNVIGIGCLAV